MEICHRDINPNNILISTDVRGKPKVTLIDFNVSKVFADNNTSSRLQMMTNTGTPNYVAPEMFNGWAQSYDERVDIWSCGAVLYYILTGGIHAFSQEDNGELKKQIEAGCYDT